MGIGMNVTGGGGENDDGCTFEFYFISSIF